MSTRSTEGGQNEKVFDRIRTHEVGRARVYLKRKVLAVAAHLDGDRVDARAGMSVQ
jgi:fructose-specific component phosphotransferase system IIB-like protein